MMTDRDEGQRYRVYMVRGPGGPDERKYTDDLKEAAEFLMDAARASPRGLWDWDLDDRATGKGAGR